VKLSTIKNNFYVQAIRQLADRLLVYNHMEQPKPGNQQIQIKDNFAGAEYANGMQLGHTKEEFLLTFLNIVPPSGRVVGKIIVNPGHLKRIIRVMQETLKKYEAQFGAVAEAENPKEEIGFKAE
jgi:hypothetical protein